MAKNEIKEILSELNKFTDKCLLEIQDKTTSVTKLARLDIMLEASKNLSIIFSSGKITEKEKMQFSKHFLFFQVEFNKII